MFQALALRQSKWKNCGLCACLYAENGVCHSLQEPSSKQKPIIREAVACIIFTGPLWHFPLHWLTAGYGFGVRGLFDWVLLNQNQSYHYSQTKERKIP